ncbi:MAG: ABC transporter ATP-binding protein [Sphingobacteriales bacterium]|nr:MAG: ABC transporter ATP-binding protein [Sphingobacteriales bacterium]
MKKYSRVFGYLKQYKGKIFLYFVCILLSTIFSIFSISMLMPFFNLIFLGRSEQLEQVSKQGNDSLQWLTNFIQHLANQFNDDKFSLLLIICAFILTSIVLKNLFLYLSYYILNPLKNTVVTRLRQEVYDKILRLPIGFFTEKRKGDIMSRMTTDIGEIETSVVGTLEGWIRDPLQILFCIIYLFYLSVQLTLFMLLLLPIMGFVIGRIGRSLKKQSKAIAELSGESVSILDETLTGLRVIKAFTAEKLLGGRFIYNNNKLLQARNAIGYRRDLASPLSETMGILVFCFILLYGGSLILNHSSGSISGGTFIVYLGMFYNIINPAKTLSTSFYNIQKGSAAIVRIEEVLKAPVTVDDNPAGIKKESFDNSIELINVGFNYEDVSILKNINLRIEKGKTIALVGSSGAGKSTLVDLIPRFHDVSSGELLIDGKNIKEYSLKHLRNLMGIVTQEPILFNDTIANNIALGKPDATKEEIEQAAKIANAYNFIIQKENGFDTNIGDRGNKLSGGEKQRLTIARAVLKNPPILILDEATSSLDTESERLVQDAINHLMRDRTSVVIAHRLSTVRHADEIIVLQKGEIVERGTHDELVAKNGFYKRLVEMQEVK